MRNAELHSTKKDLGHHGGAYKSWMSAASRLQCTYECKACTDVDRKDGRNTEDSIVCCCSQDQWLKLHNKYVEEVQAAETAGERGLDVLFFGDSIMEEWRCVLYDSCHPTQSLIETLYTHTISALRVTPWGFSVP